MHVKTNVFWDVTSDSTTILEDLLLPIPRALMTKGSRSVCNLLADY
jgi:hypothetical protein